MRRSAHKNKVSMYQCKCLPCELLKNNKIVMSKTDCMRPPPSVLQVISRPGSPVNGLYSPTSTSRHNTLRQSPVQRRKSRSQRDEFFSKYSPLSSRDLFANQKPKKNPFILDPTGRKAYNWLIVVGVAVLYFTWTIVARISFPGLQSAWLLWMALDLLCCLVYVADVIIQSRTSYLQDGILESDIAKMVDRYTQGWQFYVDVISAVPMDWIYLVLKCSYPPLYLHFPKLLKLYRLKQFSDRTESRSHFPNLSRILFLLHNMVVIIHWNACIYFSLSRWIGYGSDRWVYPAWNSSHTMQWGDLSRQYIYSFYWSALTLTTIGEMPQPHTNLEYLFMICDYLIGMLMFAAIVGAVGNIITNTQKSKAKFQNKMDNIKVYMKKTNVPEHLREKVIKWFDYLWTHGYPMDDQGVLSTLPEKLKAEIGIYVHFETLKKVDFFSVCDPGLLWELVVRLRTQVYSPAEYVCRKGDVGREMYIVNSGKLEVLAEEDGIVLKQLTHGEYFGEISVLNLGTGKSHRRRTAFVRSVGFSTLLCLSQSDLLDVLKDYPETMEMLVAKGKKRLSRDSMSKQEDAPPLSPSITVQDCEEEERSDAEDEPKRKISCSSISQSSGEEFMDRRVSVTSNASLNDSFSPLQAETIADQVSEMHSRMDRLEGLLTELLYEVRTTNNNKQLSNGKTHSPGTSTLYKITERIRKVSSQF